MAGKRRTSEEVVQDKISELKEALIKAESEVDNANDKPKAEAKVEKLKESLVEAEAKLEELTKPKEAPKKKLYWFRMKTNTAIDQKLYSYGEVYGVESKDFHAEMIDSGMAALSLPKE